MTMIEKMARAMASVEGGPAFYERLSRAALNALLEPDEVMVAVAVEADVRRYLDKPSSLETLDGFKAMIQAALASQEA